MAPITCLQKDGEIRLICSFQRQDPLAGERYTSIYGKSDGNPISKGSYGTPSIWYENGLWYLFYEREDLGIWLATSPDLRYGPTNWMNLL